MGIKKSLLLITLISALTLAVGYGCRGDGSGKTGGEGNSDARSTVNRDSIDCDDDVADSCDGGT